MIINRHLDWDGCFNVRDLGGLDTTSGRKTRWGAIVRSDAPYRLTSAGWAALQACRIRTIIDLRNDDERWDITELHRDGVTIVHVPLDDIADIELWQPIWDQKLHGSPLYYRSFLERKPERCARPLPPSPTPNLVVFSSIAA